MSRTTSLVLPAMLALFATSPACAWNRAGHMVTGAIAYDVLEKENPQALAKVVALLKQHPHYDKLFARRLERVAAEDRDQALLMMSARWADDIRDERDYNQSQWHYIDFPYKPPGQPDTVQTADPPQPNIQIAFRQNVEVLQGKGSDAEKAVALTWLFHLIGDGHQPLHSVSLFTTDYPAPEGDQGGNKNFVRATADAEPIKLHRFWDDLVLGSDDTREVKKTAIELRGKYPRSTLDPRPKQVSPVDFDRWIQESFQLAKTDVYRSGKITGSPKRDDAFVLPENYVQRAKVVGERRVTQAGYRLASLLAKLAP